LEPPVLLLQLLDTKRALDRPRENLGLERLSAEIVRAERDRLERVRAIVLPGQHDHLGVRSEHVHLFEQAETFARVVRIRRKPEIHGHHRRLATS